MTQLGQRNLDVDIATVLRGVWWAWEAWDPALLGRQRSLEWAHGKVRLGRSGALAAKIDAMSMSPTDDEWEVVEKRVRALVGERREVPEQEIESLITEVIGQ